MLFKTTENRGNMASNLANRVSDIVEIEDDVIDLDGAEKTPEEVIYEWDAKIRKKLSMFAVADNENILGDLMNEYLQSLQDMARTYEDNESLKNKVYCHISFLYSYYVELQCCTPDNYLSNMEDILTVYCNLELEVIRPLKKKDFSKREYKRRKVSVCRRIIHMLTVYLLERHDHILHVLIKINTNNVSDSCSDVLNVLYTHFLTKVPAFNLCDESFCRSYIVFQKWKEIRKVEDWEGMDKIMYKMFKRTPESIKNNETLRQILMPACQSTVGIVLNLFRSFRDISNAYFKHIIAKRNREMDDLDFNIDLGEDEPIIPVDDENDEEVTFLKAYYEVERNMSNLPQNTNESSLTRKCKEELDEDDDVQFIGVITAEPPRKENFIFSDKELVCRSVTQSTAIEVEDNEPPIASTSTSSVPAKDKGPDLEHLNGITRIPSSAIAEPSSSPVDANVAENSLFAISSVAGNVAESESEANQPQVSLVSNTAQVPTPTASPSSDLPGKIMKSVEVQADLSEHVYNDYGLTTPPFDVPERPAEPCVYASIGQSASTRTVEVQVEPSGKNCSYNDYGLTPPNDDHPPRVEATCLYTTIGRNHQEKAVEYVDQAKDASDCDILPNTKKKPAEEMPALLLDQDPEYGDLDQHLDISQIADMDPESDTEEIDIMSCQEPEKDPDALPTEETDAVAEDLDALPAEGTNAVAEELDALTKDSEEANAVLEDLDALTKDPYPSFQPNDQIDTGQKLILNTAPDIDKQPVNGETLNGIKPLASSNRTNGQAKDVAGGNSAKIIYTSAPRIKAASLDEFSKFENSIQLQWNKMKENHELDKVFAGPVSKITPVKHNSFGPQLDVFGEGAANSRSNSPTEVTSPAYEGIEDFRNYYFGDRANGRVLPAPPPPQGILKKANGGPRQKKNFRIAFDESACDHSEERRARSDGVLVPKRVRRDRKLNMEPRVVVERLSFIENKMKKILNNPPTLRVDYDKTTRHINEKDVVRCISPPRFSWMIKSVDFPRSRHNSGSLTVKNREHLEKKPKKRKFEPQSESTSEPAITRKRAFRTSKKKPLGVKDTPRKRQKPSTTENNFVSKSDSEFDKLLNSGSYSNKPFRLDLTS